ncbi:MAG: hypothetical protein GWM87_14705 [Xanthomonadales bacterium]|nr:hypothetical protein [Xanthomonadales bacterium]NIX14044.1 hypothetical protein [Xanthomonadales bacterium]
MRILLALLLLAAFTACAQEPPEGGQAEAPAAAPAPCTSEKHRQFDFWLGAWEVTTPDGQPAGHNEIELVHGGCALSENWVSAGGGFSGSSLNIYDQANDRWHQSWVDTTGVLLQLDGGWQDGSMSMQGERPGPEGKPLFDRITWTPNEDGGVRQHWESSPDGETWTTAFDGLYVKADKPE